MTTQSIPDATFDQQLYDAAMADESWQHVDGSADSHFFPGYECGVATAARIAAEVRAQEPRNRLTGIDPQYHNAELIEIYRVAAAIETGEEGPWLNTSTYPCSIAGIQAVKDALLKPVKAEASR